MKKKLFNKNNTSITNSKDIRKFFNKELKDLGHFDCQMPDGSEDDFDSIIPDYTVANCLLNTDVECIDSNGSFPSKCTIYNDKPRFVLDVAEREYNSNISGLQWRECQILCTIKEIKIISQIIDDQTSDVTYNCIVVIEDVSVLSIEQVS